jgi:penicillin-binding protein 1A
MSAQSILKIASLLLTVPIVLASHILVGRRCERLNIDLQRCLEAVDAAPLLPHRFVTALIAAEDHRNALHIGVDPIALLRVLFVWLRTGRVQGGSTVEQQLVRVVTARYEKTLRRKVREQLLAVALCRRRSKASVAAAYLSIAFYGSGQQGLSALYSAFGTNLDGAMQCDVLRMIAKLKYPEPRLASIAWNSRIEGRARYIAGRLQRLPNPSLQRTALGSS